MCSTGRLFLITAKVVLPPNGIEIMKTMERIKNHLQPYSDWTKVHCRFKITGEPCVLAVVEVFNVIGLERSMAGLCLIGNVSITCEPILTYETCARMFQIEEQHLQEKQFSVQATDLYLVEIAMNHSGIRQDEFLDIFREELLFCIQSACSGQLDCKGYKIIGEKKSIMFIRSSMELIEQSLLTTPMMKLNGHNIKVTCRAIQDLQSYVKTISS